MQALQRPVSKPCQSPTSFSLQKHPLSFQQEQLLQEHTKLPHLVCPSLQEPRAGSAARGPSAGKHPCFQSPPAPPDPQPAPGTAPQGGELPVSPQQRAEGQLNAPAPGTKQISHASSCVLLCATGNEAKPAFGQSQKRRALFK